MAFMALQAANTGAQYVAGRRAATSVEQQANYEGDVLDLNARQADAQATDALSRGRLEENRLRADTRGLIGAQRAALGSSGLDLNVGSAVDVQADAAGLGEFDAMTLRNNARREAYGYQVDAATLRNRALLARTAGRNQAAGIRDAAASTLLTGALSTYGSWAASRTSASPAAIRSATQLGRGFANSQGGY
jgi:hypothetical protein